MLRRIFTTWGVALSLALGAAGLIAACAGDTSAPVVPDANVSGGPNHLLGGLLPSGLVRCRALPYDSTSAVIGAAGGTLTAGPHTLTIPAGALDHDVLITMAAPSDTISSVRFSPDGLTFDASRKPRLTLDYRHCDLLSLLPKQIVYVDEQLNLLEQLLSLDILRLFQVEAPLDHFSRYAVAY